MVEPGRKKALGGTVESRNCGKSPEILKDGTAENHPKSKSRQVKRETVKQNRSKRLTLESNGSAENCVPSPPPQKKVNNVANAYSLKLDNMFTFNPMEHFCFFYEKTLFLIVLT